MAKKNAKHSEKKTLQERAKAELKKAKTKFMEQEKKVKEYTKENPEKALAIATGIGVALGAATVAMIRRRK